MRLVSASFLVTLKEREVLRLQFRLSLHCVCSVWFLKGTKTHRRQGSSSCFPCLSSSTAMSRVFLFIEKEEDRLVFETILTSPFTLFSLSLSFAVGFLPNSSCKDVSLRLRPLLLVQVYNSFQLIDTSRLPRHRYSLAAGLGFVGTFCLQRDHEQGRPCLIFLFQIQLQVKIILINNLSKKCQFSS